MNRRKSYATIENACSTWRERHSVSLAVEQAADLRQLALPFHIVLDGGTLHEERVRPVLLQYPVYALLITARVHARLRGLHEGVQFLICRDGRTLRSIEYPHCLTRSIY